MKLGLNMGYWQGGPPAGALDLIQEADRLGFDSLWTAEAYGSDALTPLSWWGAHTERLRLGTAIMQMSARAPAATAMAAMTLDHLSGGRFVLGLGVSGPQVVEGWYGQPFPKPLARTREYLAIVRQVLAREGPLTHQGEHFTLPIEGGTGQGKALKSSVRPLREDLPIYLAAEGPKNVALAAELCDGWMALFYSPTDETFYKDALSEGFAREGARRTPEEFEVVASVPIVLDEDVDRAVDSLRPMYALYFGGMGSRKQNFHADVPRRMGYEREVDSIQDLYLEGKKEDAATAVPRKLIEELALVGPADKVRHELDAWRDSRVSTILVDPAAVGDAETLRTLAELAAD